MILVMRYIYSICIYLLMPLILLYLKVRGKKNSDYNKYVNQRFGYRLRNPSNKPIIWIHGVSVGETRAMMKLVHLIQHEYPDYQLLLTQMTPTGRNTAISMYKNVIVHYLPYDLPLAIKNFYQIFKPKIALIMETEIWPNIIHYANKNNIPLLLLNARLSTNSFQSYLRVKSFMSSILNKIDYILCQDLESLNYFKKLGYNNNATIINNMKFDIIDSKVNSFDGNYFRQDIMDKKIVIFSSTGKSEEEMFLKCLNKSSQYLVIIVPRHPERFIEVEELIIKLDFIYQKRSSDLPILPTTQVFLGDTMGEMFSYYKMSDLALIGGSFINHGGQNIIEPLFFSVPVIFGPSMYNFLKVSNDSIQYNCSMQVCNMQEALDLIDQLLLNDNILLLKNNCLKFIKDFTGGSDIAFDIIKTNFLKKITIS